MTQEYNIYYRKPQLGEDCYLINLDIAGGYTHFKWTATEDPFYSSDIIIFKDWQSAKAAADFILNYIRNNSEKFSYISQANDKDEVYCLNYGYLYFVSRFVRDYQLENLPNPEYLLDCGLIYKSIEDANAARLILEEVLYKEVRNKNLTGISQDFKSGEFVYVPNIYTNSIEIDNFCPSRHMRLVERNLLFATEEAAQEMLQLLLEVPDLLFKSRFK